MPNTSSTETGRYLVLLGEDRTGADNKLAQLAQVRILHSAEEPGGLQVLGEQCAVVFDRIGVALLRCGSPARQALQEASQAGDGAILAVEPEREVHACNDEGEALPQGGSWGVEAVGATHSPLTGNGIRVAILDTGLDLEHPDFTDRAVTHMSFIDGETVHDANGHGTHCAGIAAGRSRSQGQARYGVASEAQLYIGKVLSNAGGGADGSVLQGIDWAVANQCHIISLSLGGPVRPGERYSAVFEAVAQRALEAGCLIVAAAGNESRRPEYVAPVAHPANCPSIFAVAAVNQDLAVAAFSNGGLLPDGGEVNLAAPGVDIPSAWPMPQRYRTLSGTSMATPFVAGVAALYAQEDSSLRGNSLGVRLVQSVRLIGQPAADVGAGLVQAPR